MTDINDIYYGLLLQYRAKDYGTKTSDAFKKFVVGKAKDEWINNFNTDDLSYNNATKGKGVTVESLKVAELIAYALDNGDLKDKAANKLKIALNKLISLGYEEDNVWFIISKSANETDNAHLNLHFLNTLLAS